MSASFTFLQVLLFGPRGPQGPTGPAATGVAGITGPTGPIGITGPRGQTGPQGATGPQGQAGATGVAVSDGSTISEEYWWSALNLGGTTSVQFVPAGAARHSQAVDNSEADTEQVAVRDGIFSNLEARYAGNTTATNATFTFRVEGADVPAFSTSVPANQASGAPNNVATAGVLRGQTFSIKSQTAASTSASVELRISALFTPTS